MSKYFEILEGVTLSSESAVYRVLKTSNVDDNSAVMAFCTVQGTGEFVDIKCIQKKHLQNYKQEAKVLCYLKDRYPEENNFVNIIEMFPFHEWFCFALEKQGTKLSNFVESRTTERLRIKEIREIAKQMLMALNDLKNAGITHRNINPEHITIINNKPQSFKAKLTGFGAAGKTSKLPEIDIFKNCGYSAPEMLLGCPINESVDIWSLGCTLAFVYSGFSLYPTYCNYEYMRTIVRVNGQPHKNHLDQGQCTNQFFTLDSDWRLQSPDEYFQNTGKEIRRGASLYHNLKNLQDLQYIMRLEDPAEREDGLAFVDLLQQMLNVNPENRISPADALHHRFITMKRPLENSTSPTTGHELRVSNDVESVGSSDTKEFVRIERGVTLGRKSIYYVEEILGSGGFGTVAKCKKVGTDKFVAVKVFASEDWTKGEEEVKVMQALNSLDPDESNIIKFIDCFTYKGLFCIVQELLDLDLYSFLGSRYFKPLSVAEIRPIARQMLVTLKALRNIGITHGDIKADNILLVNHDSQPFKVKLIDFGLACRTSEFSETELIQIESYRAPEVFLGLPRDEGIDMWSLGCTLALLLTAEFLFPMACEYQVLKMIITLCGLPDKESLDKALRVKHFFKEIQSGSEISWRFKTKDEFELDTGNEVEWIDPWYDNMKSLDDLLKGVSEKDNRTEFEELKGFIHLLKMMLRVNPAERILPEDALNHPFITMEHISDTRLSSFVTEVQKKIARTQLTNPDSDFEVENNEADRDLTELKDEVETLSLKLKRGVKIIGQTNVYRIEDLLGSGAVGQVVKCRKEGTDEFVAVKIFRKDDHFAAMDEINMYHQLNILDSKESNFVKLIDYFIYKDCYCLVFELLHSTLADLLARRSHRGLRVDEIRPIAQQMLVTLSGLRRIGVAHADIKPDNIMLVNHDSQPFKVKLIDFGLAFEPAYTSMFSLVQADGYRAPEVYLGLPYDENIDTWGLGCTLAYMYLAKHLFPQHDYEVMRLIVKYCGLPDRDALDKGKHVRRFFTLDKSGPEHYWRLKTKREYQRGTGQLILPYDSFYENLESLDDFVKMASDVENYSELEDIKAFIDLLKKMLAVNPADRILPDDALKHPFITMEHLPGTSLSSHGTARVTETDKILAASRLSNSDGGIKIKDQTELEDEMETSTFKFEKGVKIVDQSDVYIIEEVPESGSCGQMIKCKKEGTDEIVDVKVFRKENHLAAIKEVNKNQWTCSCFIFKDCFCLVYQHNKS